MFYGRGLEDDKSDGPGDGAGGDADGSVAGRLSGLVDQLGGVPDEDLVLLTDSSVVDGLLLVEQARRLLDALQGSLLVEADRREVTDVLYGLRTPGWLAREAQLPSGIARSRVKVAVKLARFLPAVSEALREGRIGFDHARVLADAANPRIIDQFALIAPALCDAIDGVSFETWKRDVQALADLLDLDGGHDPSGDIERNRLTVRCVGDVTVVSGELVGEQAQIANHALNTIADELFERFKRDNQITPELEIPDRATLMALALVEACRRGLAGSNGKAPRPEVALTLTPADLNHHTDGCGGDHDDHGDHDGSGGADGPAGATSPGPGGAGPDGPGPWNLGGPCGAGGPGGPAGSCCSGRPSSDGPAGASVSGSAAAAAAGWGIGHPSRQLVEDAVSRLMLSMDTWRGMWVTDPNGTPLRETTWSTLLCDPDIHTLIHDSLGIPLDMGDQVRFATRAQRRALAARDGGCVFPGCGAPPQWCDAHHITEWHQLHKTNIDGLLLLCRHHHGVAHRKHWNVHLDTDGWTHWTTPNSNEFTGQRHQRTKPPP